MKYNLDVVIKNLDGKPVKSDDKDLTVRKVCQMALLNPSGDDKANGKRSFDKFRLAQKLHDSKGEVELEAEDVTLIKELVGKSYVPLVVGRVYETFEGIK